MARAKTNGNKRVIESYDHRDKRRVNNPPVGLVTPDTDPDAGARKTYAYDPHLDPQLQWAGKTEQGGSGSALLNKVYNRWLAEV